MFYCNWILQEAGDQHEIPATGPEVHMGTLGITLYTLGIYPISIGREKSEYSTRPHQMSNNIWCNKENSKFSSDTRLCLLSFLLHQTLIDQRFQDTQTRVSLLTFIQGGSVRGALGVFHPTFPDFWKLSRIFILIQYSILSYFKVDPMKIGNLGNEINSDIDN